MKIVAVVPAKAQSRRCPAKNFRPLGGRPLWQWTVDAALGSKYVSEIIVTTDAPDAQMRSMALAEQITIRDRGADLCEHGVSVVEAVRDAIMGVRLDAVLMLLPSAPFRTAADIDAVVKRWHELGEQVAVVTVSPCQQITRKLRRVSVASGILVHMPEAEHVLSNGAAQIATLDYFQRGVTGFWRPGPVYPHRLSAKAGLDIDDEGDWAVALHYAGEQEDDRAP